MTFRTLLIAGAALALAPLASATEIDVTYSEDFAEILAEELGEREGELLAAEVREDLTRELAKAGVDPARVSVTILKAKPNKPTMGQMSKQIGLDYGRSISLGGMKLEATAYDANGKALNSLKYGWFENDLDRVIGYGTWTDARRVSNRFARKFAKSFSG